MAGEIKEKNVEKFKERLSIISNDLSRIDYIESVLKKGGLSLEVKRFLLGELAELYREAKMYEKAASSMSFKAGIEVMSRERIDSYIFAAELYLRAGKIDEAENMFVRAKRNADFEQISKINLAKKNLYFLIVKELESKKKKASAVKFYEKLIKMDLSKDEKVRVKEKLLLAYKSLGLFREAKILEKL